MGQVIIIGRNGNYPTTESLPELSQLESVSAPYPEAMMRAVSGQNKGYPRVVSLPELSAIPSTAPPYPEAIMRCLGAEWNDGYPFVIGLPGIEKKNIYGAFKNAVNLSSVSIPFSVKTIGEYAFTNTALEKVTIAPDCTYYPTSFPEGCEVSFYGGGGDYVPLADSEEYILLDSDGARIYVRSE